MKSENPFCNCLFFTSAALARKLGKLAERSFETSGLSASHAFILMSVVDCPGIQPGQLSKIVMLEPSTVTRLIEKLEQRGLVVRSNNGKKMHIHATEQGIDLTPALRVMWKNLYVAYNQLIGETDAKQLNVQVNRAVEQLDEQK